MTLDEAHETTRIHRVASCTGPVLPDLFAPPHHPIADVGLIGSGPIPMPGEGSLAPHSLR